MSEDGEDVDAEIEQGLASPGREGRSISKQWAVKEMIEIPGMRYFLESKGGVVAALRDSVNASHPSGDLCVNKWIKAPKMHNGTSLRCFII